ncbi:DUF5344 family protein [Bacillus massilinigeriensis]|uniref:DUF5344 family protein n=1 Tax=Bacillus mediterraneensis TaxID=1805474 RepID=UPI0008F8CE68|nr:DUF5344 family protein [Bacillus mediterraneensis]
MGEIKYNYNAIDAVTKRMESSVISFEASMPDNLGHENRLDLVNKLKETNDSLEEIMKTYKSMLESNIAIVRDSSTLMKETDQSLKTNINLKR